jgi:hypothetical protein
VAYGVDRLGKDTSRLVSSSIPEDLWDRKISNEVYSIGGGDPPGGRGDGADHKRSEWGNEEPRIQPLTL